MAIHDVFVGIGIGLFIVVAIRDHGENNISGRKLNLFYCYSGRYVSLWWLKIIICDDKDDQT